MAAAVPADEFDSGAWHRDVEHARVCGVGQIEPNDFSALSAQRRIGFTADQHHVAEPAHRRIGCFLAAELSDRAVFDQDVVERQQDLAVRGRPVVVIVGDDEDVPERPISWP